MMSSSSVNVMKQAIGQVLEGVALKYMYGYTEVKILEKVYALPKNAVTRVIQGTARAEEAIKTS